MALKRYAKPFWEAYAIFDLLRTLGFSSDDIYVGFDYVGGVGHDTLFVQLHAQGKRAVIQAGRLLGASKSSVLDSWQRFCGEVRSADQHALRAVLAQTVFGTNEAARGVLRSRLKKAGFRLKALEN